MKKIIILSIIINIINFILAIYNYEFMTAIAWCTSLVWQLMYYDLINRK